MFKDMEECLPRTQTSLSLSMKMCAQMKAGRRKRASPRFLPLPVVHCVSSPVHSRFAPEEAGELLFVSLYKIIYNVNHS